MQASEKRIVSGKCLGRTAGDDFKPGLESSHVKKPGCKCKVVFVEGWLRQKFLEKFPLTKIGPRYTNTAEN
jgi:hypothetical protein